MSARAFPDRFLWGAATAAHQVEGNNINSESWALERLPSSPYAEPSGDAIDHYHRYAEDIALLAGLGLNAYRFSVEWARIEPEEGDFSLAALERYRRVLGTCWDRGLAPVVTFHHFTSPRWLMRRGGWLDAGTPERYARYVEKAAGHLGDLVAAACTFNEANLSLLLQRLLPFDLKASPFWTEAAAHFGVEPDRLGLWQFVTDRRMHEVIFEAHRRGSEILKAGPRRFPVDMTLALSDVQAAEGGEERAAELRRELSTSFLERLRGDDFVGVQTYSRLRVGPDGVAGPPPGAELTQTNEEFYPEALEGTVRLAAAVARIPVIVTENGVAAEDDARRIEYLRRAIAGLRRCMDDGVDVRGYFCWSAFDNFEWVAGYGPKFGLIAVDRATQERRPKPSARWLGELARRNGRGLDLS